MAVTDGIGSDGFDSDDIRCNSLINGPISLVYRFSHDLLTLFPDALQLEIPVGSPLPSSHTSALNDLIRHSEVVFQFHSVAVLRISTNIAVKIHSNIPEYHVEVVQHVCTHAPSIPAPRTHGLLAKEVGYSYHFMDYIPGNTLESVWPRLSVPQKCSVRDQLTPIFRMLREIPPPSTLPGTSAWGWKGICIDTRHWERVSRKVIEDEAGFNDFLTIREPRPRGSWMQMVCSSMRKDHKLVMTHSDLHPRNIIVQLVDTSGNSISKDSDRIADANVVIASIIDWEKCGFYPEYWEFVKALHTVSPDNHDEDWWEYLPESIGIWPAEFCLDKQIMMYLG